MTSRRTRRLVTAAGAGAAAVLLAMAVLLIVPSDEYIFLPDRAHPVAPLVSIAGRKPEKQGRGGIYFVDVFVRKASLLERVFPGIRDGARLHPAIDVTPPGVSEKARRKADLRAMAQSQQVAAAVALRALGYRVGIVPRGAVVEEVDPSAPAHGHLERGDTIVSIDGRRVRTPDEVQRLIFRHRPGDEIRVGVRRGNELRPIVVRAARDPRHRGRVRIGIAVTEAAAIKLPVKVRIDAGNVGGPSAGLAFALDVMQELGRDVARGRRIAATGEIRLNGAVGPVGGLEQKTYGARRSNVDVFLVPAGENAAVARRYADGLRIVPVRSFQQALQALATLPAKR